MSITVVSAVTTRGDDGGFFTTTDTEPVAVFIPVGRKVVLSDGSTHRNAISFRVESSASRLTDHDISVATRKLDEWQEELIAKRNKG